MILSRAPTRITLGGGGTDLKSYYSKKGGFLIAGAINKYCTILCNRSYSGDIRASYSQMEIKKEIADIGHPIIRAVLELVCNHNPKGLEIHSTADVPESSGLGTSSSFTVALLSALHAYSKDFVTQKQLADEACHIEIDILGEPIGKQDQYLAAFGGLTCLTFEKNGDVIVEPLRITSESIDQLENDILLFFTGKQRSASAILSVQDNKCKDNDSQMIQNLDQVKEIGLETRKYLERGQIEMLGEILHTHWEIKKKRSNNMTDPFIDECYEVARKNGAIGGKIVGAGGGGFLMFICNNLDHDKLRLMTAMDKLGLKRERFHFDFEGAKIMINT
ncbi:galactokinase [Chloroflexota bacterium]